LISVIGDLNVEFGGPIDQWMRMPVHRFLGWVAELRRRQVERARVEADAARRRERERTQRRG
jgi:hypothetical protein